MTLDETLAYYDKQITDTYRHIIEMKRFIKECDNKPIQINKTDGPIFKIVNDDGTVINKIIHIADIHIKKNIIDNKYELVFNKFYSELKELRKTSPNTLICFCGDLFRLGFIGVQIYGRGH